MALTGPTRRFSHQLAPVSAPDRPRRENTKPSRAPSLITRKSVVRATAAPPPKASPLTAATVGTGSPAIALMPSLACRNSVTALSRSPSRRSCSASKSPPAEKATPSPVSTIARASGSAATPAQASIRSVKACGFSALRTSGRRNVTVWMPRSSRSWESRSGIDLEDLRGVVTQDLAVGLFGEATVVHVVDRALEGEQWVVGCPDHLVLAVAA